VPDAATVTFSCPALAVTTAAGPVSAASAVAVTRMTDADLFPYDSSVPQAIWVGYNRNAPARVAHWHADLVTTAGPWFIECGIPTYEAHEFLTALAPEPAPAATDTIAGGSVTGIALTGGGGRGYVSGSGNVRVTLTGGGSTVPATAHAIHDGNGAIIAFDVDTAGSGCTSAPTVTVDPAPVAARTSLAAPSGSSLSTRGIRTTPDSPYNIQSDDRSSFSQFIGHANDCGMEPWVLVPQAASDACAAQMSGVTLAGTPAGRKVYLEYTNEFWNSALGFTQFL
jgi:hypothetical protein